MNTAQTIPMNTGERRIPGERDFWIFIMAEMLMFGIFFITFIVHRSADIELFNTSQEALSRNLGALNTLFLVTSSWAVVRSIEAARVNHNPAVVRNLAIAFVLALAFVLVKYFEYTAKFKAGIYMTTNTFYMFYYCLTMIHLLHVVGGTVMLIVVWFNAKKGRYHQHDLNGLEMTGSYWHMVDLLWIFLFPLLYLLR